MCTVRVGQGRAGTVCYPGWCPTITPFSFFSCLLEVWVPCPRAPPPPPLPGTRSVQKLVDVCRHPEEVELLVGALAPAVVLLSTDANGNHVIQVRRLSGFTFPNHHCSLPCSPWDCPPLTVSLGDFFNAHVDLRVLFICCVHLICFVSPTLRPLPPCSLSSDVCNISLSETGPSSFSRCRPSVCQLLVTDTGAVCFSAA
jgi:hypothetical protein